MLQWLEVRLTKIQKIMRQRIIKPMGFPFVGKFAEICAKCDGMKLWKDGIRFVRPALFS